MTAQVEFFCSLSEEAAILRYLTKAANTRVFDISGGSLKELTSVDPGALAPPPERVSLNFWQPSHGALIWHTSQPRVSGPTHASLVHNLFGSEFWRKRELGNGDRMLDTDLSPILQYCRGESHEGKTLPSLCLAPPSNLNRVGPEYERWVKRSLAWIRRHGIIVHNYRERSTTLDNPCMFLNTIYAFPDVLRELEAGTTRFVISVRRRQTDHW